MLSLKPRPFVQSFFDTHGKSDISKETEGKKKEIREAVEAPAYRRTIERRAAASMKAYVFCQCCKKSQPVVTIKINR